MVIGLIRELLLLNQIGLGNDKRVTKGLYAEEPIYAVPQISKWLVNRIHKATKNTRLTTEDKIRICFTDSRDGKLRWQLNHRRLTLPLSVEYDPFRLALLWYCPTVKHGCRRLHKTITECHPYRTTKMTQYSSYNARQLTGRTRPNAHDRNPDYIRGRNKAERREYRRERNRTNVNKILQGLMGTKPVRSVPFTSQKMYIDKCLQYGTLPFHNSMSKLKNIRSQIFSGGNSDRLGGGGADAKDKELFKLYLARIGQLTNNTGTEEHQSLTYQDFYSLSSKRKLRVFNELGVPAKSLENVSGFFRKADSMYPDTHTP